MNLDLDAIKRKLLAEIAVDPTSGCWNWTGYTNGVRIVVGEKWKHIVEANS